MSFLGQPTYQSIVKTLKYIIHVYHHKTKKYCIQNEEVYKICPMDKLKRENHLQPRRKLGVPPQYGGVGTIAAPNNT